ncbi:hypothetical protein B0H13DRAFT_1903421 [Mycena leptocephala]|nr:hypothetical protein B0H13DRAFT_1903421 [Mycena leptocephala]
MEALDTQVVFHTFHARSAFAPPQSYKLFGYNALWTFDDFMAARAGFDMPLSNNVTFAHHFRTLTPLEAASLIAGMYRRQIQELEDVLSHLHFVVVAPATAAEHVPLLRSLFELRFKRYLTGRGHPQWFRDQGIIATEDELQRALAIPFFRAELLLLTALESSLLPIKDTWEIRAVSLPPESSPLFHTLPVQSQPLPLQFHTCTGGVDVRVNAKLLDLMIRSPEGDEQTEFDIWVHSQLYNADLTYNTV